MTKLVLPKPAPALRHRRPRVAWVIGWIPVATLWVTACAPSILGTDPDTGLDILVTRGPIQPVAMEGEDNSAPVAGALVLIRRTHGSGDTRVRTDDRGTALARLVPGDYRVEVRECPGAMSLPSPATASVLAGQLTALELSCDTGIR